MSDPKKELLERMARAMARADFNDPDRMDSHTLWYMYGQYAEVALAELGVEKEYRVAHSWSGWETIIPYEEGVEDHIRNSYSEEEYTRESRLVIPKTVLGDWKDMDSE